MPRRKIGKTQREHWYNFIVPEEKITSFLARVEDTAQVGMREESGRYVLDISYCSLGPNRPVFITELLEQFDGIDVYETVREEKLKIIKPNEEQ